MRELYAEYRAFAVPKGKPRFNNVEDELRVLEGHAPIYETLEGRKEVDPTLTWLGRKLANWQVTTAYPIALQIAGDSVEPDEREQIARLIYSYIVRRALCGLTAKNLNRIFQSISKRFVETQPSVSALIEFFKTRPGDSTRFPDDAEFHRGILTNSAYYLAPGARNKDILWELELATRSNFSENVEMPDGLWTEHVLPVSWTDDWPFSDGDCIDRLADDPRAEERNRIVDTLGNLTLVTSALNISSGNKSFMEKKEKFEEHTGLFLNKWFSKHSAWNEDHIRERGADFAKKATKIWIGLDGVK